MAAASGRALIVDGGSAAWVSSRCAAGACSTQAALVVPPAELDAAVLRLSWPESQAASDWPWLTAWLRSPKARASFVVVPDALVGSAAGAAVRAALPRASALRAAGGNVGATREEA